MSMSMDSWVSLFSCPTSSSSGHWESFQGQLLSLSHRPLFLLSTCLLQVQLLFYLSWLWNQPVFQGVLIPFTGEWYLESKMWVLSVRIATRLSVTPHLLGVHYCSHTHLWDRFHSPPICRLTSKPHMSLC